MKHWLFFLIGVAVFFSCGDDKKKKESENTAQFNLTGTITSPASKKAYLQKVINQTWTVIDSSAIDDQGKFSFTGSVKEPDYYRIDIGNNEAVMIILENKDIDLQMASKNPMASLKIKGSPASQQYIDFHNKIQPRNQRDEYYQMLARNAYQHQKPDSVRQMEEKIILLRDSTEAFVKAYIDSIFPSMAIFTMLNYIEPSKNAPYLIELTDKLKKEMPNSHYTIALEKEVQKLRTSVHVGMVAPNFALPDQAGKVVNLNDFRGKYLLIDFWASWCGPCRAENPNVVKVYNKYKGKNFDILGVSLDRAREPWLEAIAKDNLTWKHVSDLKGWESSVVPIYDLGTGIPRTYLLDREGKIIAANLRGPALEKKLEELFGKK